MEMESVKSKILELHEVWDVIEDGSDCFKHGIHESFVIDLIVEYCIERGYEVDGFPIKKRELAKENNSYNEDYFCEARYVKYLDILATLYEDVLELMYFYSSTFWLEHFDDKKKYKNRLLEYIRCDVYEIEF